jgi:uncharacterized protein (DUF2267 family)
MDELVKTVADKAGLSPESAQKAVHAVMDFIKEKLPAGMGAQLESFIDSNAESAKGIVGSLAEKVGGLLGKKDA